jgi:hypothetical protein
MFIQAFVYLISYEMYGLTKDTLAHCENLVSFILQSLWTHISIYANVATTMTV